MKHSWKILLWTLCFTLIMGHMPAFAAMHLPDTTTEHHRFQKFVPADLEEGQYDYIANEYVGVMDVTKDVSDKLRSFHEGFPILYYMLAYGGSEKITFVDGNARTFWWGDVTGHEDWFLTNLASTYYGDRIKEGERNIFLFDLKSAYQDFVASWITDKVLPLEHDVMFDLSIGEDTIQPISWTPDGKPFYTYFPQAVTEFLRGVAEGVEGEYDTYVNLGPLRNEKDVSFSLEDAQGLYVPEFLYSYTGKLLFEKDWLKHMELVKNYTNRGLTMILETDWPRYEIEERLYIFASYLLVKGDKTYLSLRDSANFLSEPDYFPEFDLDLGAPTQTEDEIAKYRDINAKMYVRQFEKGVVLVNPDISQKIFSFDNTMRRVLPEGGGVVEGDKVERGTLNYVYVQDQVYLQPRTAMILLYDQLPEEEVAEETTTEEATDSASETEETTMEDAAETTTEEELPPVTEEEETDMTEEEPVLESEEDDDANMDEVIDLEDMDMEESTDEEAEMMEAEKVPFTDVPKTLRNATAINYLRDRNVIQGYEDGSYKPYKTVNRAELLKILIEGSGIEVTVPEKGCFPDVDFDAWYAPYVCHAKSQGWVSGYPAQGQPEYMWMFKPAQTVNKVEALKILAMVQGWAAPENLETLFTDTDKDAWYAPYLAYAREKNFLEETGSVYGPSFGMNRGKIAEYIYRTMITKERGEEVYE